MSNTPRTDNAVIFYSLPPTEPIKLDGKDLVFADFARELERELTKLNEQLENQASIIRDRCTPVNERENRMLKELATLRAALAEARIDNDSFMSIQQQLLKHY
jgi:hypothetical protein